MILKQLLGAEPEFMCVNFTALSSADSISYASNVTVDTTAAVVSSFFQQ